VSRPSIIWVGSGRSKHLEDVHTRMLVNKAEKNHFFALPKVVSVAAVYRLGGQIYIFYRGVSRCYVPKIF